MGVEHGHDRRQLPLRRCPFRPHVPQQVGRALPLLGVPARARRGVRDLDRHGDTRVAIDDCHSRLRWYASTPGAERGFCSRCGSTLFFRSRNWPGELHVAHANLDGPADRAPQAHAYWDTHVDWAAVDPADGLKRMPAPKST